MFSLNLKNTSTIAVSVILFLAIAWGWYWLVIASYYCAPNAEDFSLAIDPREHGLVNSVVNLLTFFDSRYTANFMHGLNPLAFDWVEGFFFMPLLCYIFLTGAFFYFLTSVINSLHIKLILIIYSVLFVLVYYGLAPSLPYSLFYMASTFTYIYPLIFTFIWVGSFLRSIKEMDKTRKLLFSVIGYLGIVLSYGGSELFISTNAFLLFFLLLSILMYDKRKLKYIIPYFILAVSCLGFIILCPSGKTYSVRVTSGLSEIFSDLNFITQSLRNYKIFVQAFILRPIAICFILFSGIFALKLGIAEKLNFKLCPVNLIVVGFLCIVVSYVTTWVFFIFMKTYNDFPKSIYNVTGVFVYIGIFLVIPIWISVQFQYASSKKILLFGGLCIAILMLTSLIFSSNNFSLIKKEYDLGYFQDAKNKTDKFYRDVDSVKKSGAEHTVVYFQNPEVIPASIFLRYDVLPNRTSACWNIAYEDYFGVDEVRLVGDTIFK